MRILLDHGSNVDRFALINLSAGNQKADATNDVLVKKLQRGALRAGIIGATLGQLTSVSHNDKGRRASLLHQTRKIRNAALVHNKEKRLDSSSLFSCLMFIYLEDSNYGGAQWFECPVGLERI